MPRRAAAGRRTIDPDPVHRSKLVQQVINKVMLDGKKSTAERIVYDALAILSERTGKDPVEALETSIKALTPVLEAPSRPLAAATDSVPCPAGAGGGPPRGPARSGPAAPARSPCAGSSASPAPAASARWRSGWPTSCSTPSSSRAARTSGRTTSSAWRRPTRPSRTTAGSARLEPRQPELLRVALHVRE